MTKMKLIGGLLTTSGMLCGLLSAHLSAQETPIYRLSLTPRTVKAINYQHRGGATQIDFRGTELLPSARGQAKVEGKNGYIGIEAEFADLQPATSNGPEYLTYVLWAVTPEGRTANLGEILLDGNKGKLNVTTELQVFGLVVTAEPYYAVTQPSDLIVMENVVRPDTRGKIEEIDAKYELLQRGQYQRLSNPLALQFDRKQPLELYEARNAVQIARAVGADRFAAETFLKAGNSLAQAEAYQERNAGKKVVIMTAREAVQTAEDARAIAVKRQEADALTAERQESVDREARAESGRAAAQSETDRVTREAEAARIAAQAETERLTREKNAQAVSTKAEADRVEGENQARLAAAAADADRLKLESQANAAAAASEIDRLKTENRDASSRQPGISRQRGPADGAIAGGKGRTANSTPEPVQRDTADPGHRAWSDRQHVGCSVRHRQVFAAASGAREVSQGGRHRLRASGSQAGCGRPHRQRRRRRLQSAAFRTTRRVGARLSDRTGNGDRFGHVEGLRQDSAGGFQ